MNHKIPLKAFGKMGSGIILATLFMTCIGFSSVYALDMPIGVKPAQKKNDFIPRVRAAVTVAGDYSDNVNTASGRNSHGVRLRVSPEFNLEMPNLTFLSQYFGNNRFYVNGGYRYGYMGVDGTKINFHRNAHLAYAGLRYDASPKASLGSNYIFQRDQYPFLGSGDTYTLNDVNTEFKFQPLARLTLDPYYKFQNFNDQSFDNEPTLAPLNDYGDNRVGWNTVYKLTSKVSIVGNGEYEHKSFRKSAAKDFDSFGGQGGLAIQLTPKVSASGTGGYVKRYFDVKKDLGSYLWDVKLNYVPTRKLVAGLFFNYNLVDTITTEFLVDKGSPGLIDFIPRQYRAIKVQRQGATLGYILTDKDRIDGNFTYQFARAGSGDDVTPPNVAPAHKLDETDYQWGVNYAHAFAQWLNLTLGYSNIGRNTNIADNFRANIFSFGMRLGW